MYIFPAFNYTILIVTAVHEIEPLKSSNCGMWYRDEDHQRTIVMITLLENIFTSEATTIMQSHKDMLMSCGIIMQTVYTQTVFWSG